MTIMNGCNTRLRPVGAGALLRMLAVIAFVGFGPGARAEAGQNLPREAIKMLPVCGLHVSAPAKKDLAAALDFIRELLPQEGVNTLILEFDYDFDFRSRPEFAKPSALGGVEAQKIAKACRDQGIELIP